MNGLRGGFDTRGSDETRCVMDVLFQRVFRCKTPEYISRADEKYGRREDDRLAHTFVYTAIS